MGEQVAAGFHKSFTVSRQHGLLILKTSVEKGGNEVWIGEKFQSNPEIAGSPRNSFRASLVSSLAEVEH